MKWLENEKQVLETNTIGVCPICGSSDTFFEKKIIKKETGMGYLKVGCNRCKSTETIDRVKF